MAEGHKTVVGKNFRLKVQHFELVGALLIFSVVLYGLSMGPAYRLLRKNTISQESFSTAYSPIRFISERSEPFDRLVGWYLDFWYSDARELDRLLRQLNSTEHK
jgi:hypothetical protein